ncbi:hypothetical protein [Bacillus phage vB_BpuM-ZY1]|nr:hypothetical protein [Bacillus phage vB_BpuM-ZY1]
MSWTCDSCGQIIRNAQDGWVEWLVRMSPEGGSLYAHSLRLVHHRPSSPSPVGCQYNGQQVSAQNSNIIADQGLEFFTSYDGHMELLEMVSRQEFQNPEEVLEMIKRLHIPNYEIARPYVQQAVQQGVIELNAKPGYEYQDQLTAVRRWAGV